MTLEIELADDPPRACAAMLIGAAVGGGHVVLAGGGTPRAAYEELVQAVQAVGADLSETCFWVGDERCVPPDDERSNYKMIKESLLDPLAGPRSPTVRRIKGELGPEAAAAEYERELRAAGPGRFDLVLLGIGPDGHTASLFPGQESLSERSRLVVGVPEAGLEPFVPRVTLTLSALTSARRVVFLVSGESKADAVAAAFGPGAVPDPHVPSSLLPPLAEEVTVLLDAPAARGLAVGERS
ncbi:MAG: 6-phosphogluconolactonase [Solirubrobacterales bacterium]|nr:6-phosphogluconolactonase [Solirubrobacterales bacterium]